MRAVVVTSSCNLSLREVEDPPAAIRDDEILIKVAATALNRGEVPVDGTYNPPEGSSPYPGLECSGTVLAAGRSVGRWEIGDQVCALLNGGGYAEMVVVPAALVLSVPQGVSLIEAASFPEVACTVWSTVFMTSGLSRGQTFLIHGGSSGIGTFAIQIAKYYGARVFVTAGSVMEAKKN